MRADKRKEERNHSERTLNSGFKRGKVGPYAEEGYEVAASIRRTDVPIGEIAAVGRKYADSGHLGGVEAPRGHA